MGRGKGSGNGSGSHGGAGSHLRTHNDSGSRHYPTTYQHNNFNSYQHPNHNNYNNDDYYSVNHNTGGGHDNGTQSDAGCCACCCAVGFVFFFIFKAVFATIFFSSSYSTTKITMDVGETRLLGSTSYNTFFNKGLNIRDNSASIRVFQVPKLPPMTREGNAPLLLTDIRTIANNEYHYFAYYLNQGSQIKLEFSSNVDLDMLLIRGKATFDSWVGESDDVSLVTARKFSTNNEKTQFTYTVPTAYGGGADEYYIVFDNFDKFGAPPAVVSFSLVRGFLWTLQPISSMSCTV